MQVIAQISKGVQPAFKESFRLETTAEESMYNQIQDLCRRCWEYLPRARPQMKDVLAFGLFLPYSSHIGTADETQVGNSNGVSSGRSSIWKALLSKLRSIASFRRARTPAATTGFPAESLAEQERKDQKRAYAHADAGMRMTSEASRAPTRRPRLALFP